MRRLVWSLAILLTLSKPVAAQSLTDLINLTLGLKTYADGRMSEAVEHWQRGEGCPVVPGADQQQHAEEETGGDGKQREYWKDPAGGRPAYFVPQSAWTADVAEQ